jgi:hypothetical protein
VSSQQQQRQQQQLSLQRKRPAQTTQNPNAGEGPGFFSLFRRPPQQPQVQQPQQIVPRPFQPPPQPGWQPFRPPGYIDRAASVPPPGIAR